MTSGDRPIAERKATKAPTAAETAMVLPAAVSSTARAVSAKGRRPARALTSAVLASRESAMSTMALVISCVASTTRRYSSRSSATGTVVGGVWGSVKFLS